MTDDKLIELAKQAGFKTGGVVIRTIHSSGAWVGINNELERFAQLVRNEALEEAALVCDGSADRALTLTGAARADACAYKIRSMKK